jgi:hypothetical protein
MPQVNRKRHESGYAILMVFLLAATIAISLYEVAPRVAFESQRDKEQLLVDRGEQYKRAIQLYYRKFRRYPVKMEDLDNTQNIRFLRQHYVDPMTGKNEWRLIHIGPGGQFTDSLTQKNNTTKKQDPASVNTFIAEYKSVSDPTDAADQLSPALRRRPSDQAAASGGTLGGDGDSMAAAPDPNNPAANTGVDPNLNAGAFPPGGAFPGTAIPGDGSAAANPTGYVPGGEMPLPNGQTLPTGGAAGNMATYYPPATGPAAIQQLLTSPRPGGPPPGIFNPSGRPMNDYGFVDANGNNIPSPSNPQPVISPPAGPAFGGSAFGGNTNPAGGSAFGGSSFNGQSVGGAAGLTSQTGTTSGAGNFATGSFAGVASTVKRRGIKKYADYSKYNEWEFIYDYSKDVAKASGLPVNGAAGANGNSLPLNGTQSPFGSTQGNNSTNSTNGSSGSIGSTSPTPAPSPTSN